MLQLLATVIADGKRLVALRSALNSLESVRTGPLSPVAMRGWATATDATMAELYDLAEWYGLLGSDVPANL